MNTPSSPNAHIHTHPPGFAIDGATSLLPARLSSLSALLPSACPRAPLVPLCRPAESPHTLKVCTSVKHPLTRTGSLRLCCHSNLGAHSPSSSSSAGSVGEETACLRLCTSQGDSQGSFSAALSLGCCCLTHCYIPTKFFFFFFLNS